MQTSTLRSSQQPDPSRRRFAQLALRDLALIALAIALWYALAPLSADETNLADAAGVLAGLGVVLTSYLLHEWGHAIGAWATRARLHAPERLSSISLFSFDVRSSSRLQFAVMSLAGFAVTAAAVVLVGWHLPENWLATRVARGGVLVLAGITLFIELPLLIYGVITNRIPSVVAVFDPGQHTQTSGAQA